MPVRSVLLHTTLLLAAALPAQAQQVQSAFVIAMENHNWTQPGSYTANQPIKGNPNAPFINALVNGTAVINVGGQQVNISQQVAYTDNYHSVGYNAATGTAPAVHPSEPNYIWSEAGTNFGVLNDNQPYGPGGTNQNTTQHLSGLLQQNGVSWKSYQEDIDLSTNANSARVNVVAPSSQWVSPITNASGTFGAGSPPNAYNGGQQYDYAVKHNPQAFFTDTNGGNDATPANPAAAHYAPLQQLATDLATGSTAKYNWITPDQFNDQHTTLAGGYKGLTGDAARIKQGDDFLSQLIPQLINSAAYQNNGAIVLWWDETEGGDSAAFTIPEIVISPLAHPNVGGLPYNSPLILTHSSDLKTWQELFGVSGDTPTGFLGDAGTPGINDLSDLFAPNAITRAVPEPMSLMLLGSGLLGMAALRRRRI